MNNTTKDSDNEAETNSEPKPAKKVNKKKKKSRQKNTQTTESTYSIPSIDQSVWNQLPSSVRKLIADTKRKQKQRQENEGSSGGNSNANGGNQSRRTNNVRASEEANNDQSGSEDESGERDGQQNQTPSLRSVMRSNRSRRQSKQTATITVHKKKRNKNKTDNGQEDSDSDVEDDIHVQEEVLIDSGADTSCLGPAFRVIATTDRIVDIVGYDENKVAVDLPIGDGVTLATNAEGEKVLLRVNEAIINANCKSILSVDQMRHYDIDVNEKPKRYGGKQNLVTLEEQELPLRYKESLVWLKIERPSKEDLTSYPIIQLTSDQPWDPGNQCDDERAANPTRMRPKPPEVERIRQCLGWKPHEVVEKTMKATTQYVRNSLRLPMRQHFKTRNRALFVNRLRETVCTDTFFSSVKALNGETCVQLYVGKTSALTEVFGMTSESQMYETLQDFIIKWGAPNCLFSDGAKAEFSKNVKRILREYGIRSHRSEPYHQNQNLAERRIQDVKMLSNTILDRTNSPEDLWFLATEYSAYLLNHLAVRTLNWKTPIEVATGETPDISNLLQFHWYEKVYYLDPRSSYPSPREKLGHFVGVAEDVGDTLTYKVLTSDTRQVIFRSVVRPADVERNLRAESETSHELKDQRIFSESDLRNDVEYPTIDPEVIVGRNFVVERDGVHY